MNMKSLIDAQTKNIASATEAESQITVRLPTSTVSEIEELAFTLDVPRNTLLSTLIKDGLTLALNLYDSTIDETVEDLWVDEEKPEARRFVILNTNKRYSIEDHRYISGGIAAAFHGRKHRIDQLRKDTDVYIYENGVGIIGWGKASGETIVKDYGKYIGDLHEQSLIDYSRVAPLSAKTIRKIIGRNLPFLHTIFKLRTNDGLEIEKHLQRI
jgi:hypothetical protein